MTDSINTLPLEGWAYKITDRPCSHHKDGRHKGDCSVCTREVLVEAVEAETKKMILRNEAMQKALDWIAWVVIAPSERLAVVSEMQRMAREALSEKQEGL